MCTACVNHTRCENIRVFVGSSTDYWFLELGHYRVSAEEGRVTAWLGVVSDVLLPRELRLLTRYCYQLTGTGTVWGLFTV